MTIIPAISALWETNYSHTGHMRVIGLSLTKMAVMRDGRYEKHENPWCSLWLYYMFTIPKVTGVVFHKLNFVNINFTLRLYCKTCAFFNNKTSLFLVSRLAGFVSLQLREHIQLYNDNYVTNFSLSNKFSQIPYCSCITLTHIFL